MMSFIEYLEKNKGFTFDEFTSMPSSERIMFSECYNTYLAEQLSFPPERHTFHEDSFTWDRLPIPRRTPRILLAELDLQTTLG